LFRISILGFRISRFCPPSSETSVNQKRAIMQNKAKFPKIGLIYTLVKQRVIKMDIDFWPKNPKPNFKIAKMNVTLVQITSYQLPVTNHQYENKPNSNPIQSQSNQGHSPHGKIPSVVIHERLIIIKGSIAAMNDNIKNLCELCLSRQSLGDGGCSLWLK